MRNTWKKTAAFLLAFTLAAVPLSQTGVKGGLFGRSGIVAYAVEESETFNTDYHYEDDEYDSYGEPYTYTGTHFKIDVTRSGDEDGFFLYSDGQHRATITALNGENITKIEVVRGYYDGQPSVSSSAAVKYINGDTFTFTNINAASVTLDKCTGYDICQIKQIKIYYGDPVYDISTATVNLGADNSVSSITVGDDTITDLSGFDITYGVSDTDHTATSVPTAAGTYYAYVTPKSGNETYIGTAKSASFTVAVPLTGSGTQEDPYLINSLVELATYAYVDEYAAGSYIQLTADLVNDGDFSVTKSSYIMLNGHTFTSGSFTVNNDVVVAVNGGIINAPITNNGLVNVLGGTINGAITNNNVFLINNGTISDAITNNGNINMFGGTVSGNITCSDQIHVFGGTISGDIDISETGILRAVKNADVNNGAPTFNGVISNSGSTFISYGTFANDPSTINNVEIPEGYYVKTVTENDTTVYQVLQKLPKISSASVTLNDGFGLNFYVDNITDAAGYTVMFDGACDENGTQVALTEKDGKFFATANVNAKDIKEDITATLYKDGTATGVTLTSSVDTYLTKALADTSFDDKTKALLKATQLYGCTADNYFNNAENDFNQMFDDFLTYAGLASDQTPLYVAINNAVANDNVNDEKVSLVLNSKVKLRIYSDNGTNENNYGKYSEITGLTPLTMGQNQTVGGCSVSGYTWVDRVLEKNEIDKNYYMAMALASYMYAAEKYAIVDVASVTLDQPALTLTAGGDTATLTATVLPENATDKTVTWSSDNEAVATVVNGVVIPVGAGTATITATAGGKTAECTVSVTPASILNDGDVIIVNGYYQNNSSTFSGQGTYNDGSITDVSTSLNGNIDSMSFNYDENKLIVSMKRSTSNKTVTIDLLTGTYTEAKSGHPTTSSRITFSKLTINGVTVPLTAQ